MTAPGDYCVTADTDTKPVAATPSGTSQPGEIASAALPISNATIPAAASTGR